MLFDGSGTVTWPMVALALIAALPGIIAAVASLSARKNTQTSNGTTMGAMVEEMHTDAAPVRANAGGEA